MNTTDPKQATKGIRILKRIHAGMATVIALLIIVILANIYLFCAVAKLQAENAELRNKTEQSQQANEQVLEMLKEIRSKQDEQTQKQEQALELKLERRSSIRLLKTNGINSYSDLGNNNKISARDMDKIIDYYNSMIKGGTPFKGKGAVFVKASEETGLNPIYLFAHAACESAFGKSYLAKTRGNYFGINAVDNNPSLAYHMGDGVEQGIIAGAKWIKSNYYDHGYTTLASMKRAGYASDSNWDSAITQIANESIAVL